VHELIPVLPCCMGKAEHVRANSADRTYAIQEDFRRGAGTRPDRSPEGTDTGLEFRKHTNEIGSLEVFAR